MEKYDLNHILTHFISVEVAMKELSIPARGSTTISFVSKNLYDNRHLCNLEMLKLDHKIKLPDGTKSEYFVRKTDLETFKNNYISVFELKKVVPNTTLTTMFKQSNVSVIKIQETVATGMFIHRDFLKTEVYTNYQLFKQKDQYASKTELCNALGLNSVAVGAVLDEFNIPTILMSGKVMVEKRYVPCLIEHQKQAMKLLDNYYLGSKAKELLGRSFTKDQLRPFKRIKFPLIIPHDNPADKSGFLWLKTDVDLYLKDRSLRELTKIQLDNAFDTFVYRLEAAHDFDTSKFMNTKMMWFDFVKTRLNESASNDDIYTPTSFVRLCKICYRSIRVGEKTDKASLRHHY